MFVPGMSYKRLLVDVNESPELEDWTYLGWSGCGLFMRWQGPGGEIEYVMAGELEVTVEW